MPLSTHNKTIVTLGELTRSIQKTIAQQYNNAYWVKAELNKLNFYRPSGHCYPELVDKDAGKIVAQMRATLWREDYRDINHRFMEVLKEPLKDGIKVLLLVRVSFDPVYGLSLRIIDIDPSYTLGDLEKEKQLSIDRLLKEKIFDANKQLTLPLLPQRIAVISAESSKGYADFTRIIDQNPWGYRFYYHLFLSVLQGDKAVEGILKQLRLIRRVKHHFDLVAIVRGGGGDIGLSCYNHYNLAREVALFPLPVLTGIGHATNETVVEMVAHANEITPTKLAESLLQHLHNFDNAVLLCEDKVKQYAQQELRSARQLFGQQAGLFRIHTHAMLYTHHSRLKEHTTAMARQVRTLIKQTSDYVIMQQVQQLRRQSKALIKSTYEPLDPLSERLKRNTTGVVNDTRTKIGQYERSVKQLHPENVLKRGFSITRHKGTAIKSAIQVSEGQALETTLYDGFIQSKIVSVSKANSKHRKNEKQD